MILWNNHISWCQVRQTAEVCKPDIWNGQLILELGRIARSLNVQLSGVTACDLSPQSSTTRRSDYEMDLWYVWNVNWLTVSLSSSAVRFSAFKRSLITLVNNFSDVICLRGREVSYFFKKILRCSNMTVKIDDWLPFPRYQSFYFNTCVC